MYCIQECPTQWGSMNKMIARILEQEEAIRRVLSSDRKTASLSLTWQDKDVLESMNKVLSRLSSLTDILSGDSYVTISSVVPMLALLNNSILKNCDDDTELTATLKQAVKDDMNSRYNGSEASQLLKIASFLDPRFKSKYVDDIDEVKQLLISEVTVAVSAEQQPVSVTSTDPCEQPSVSSSYTDSQEPGFKKRKATKLGAFFKQNEIQDDTVAPLSPEQKVTKEIEVYVTAPRMDVEDELLSWWRENNRSYPMLSVLACKYLAVCAASCPSERLFSSSGYIVNPLRGNLNPEKVDMLVFF